MTDLLFLDCETIHLSAFTGSVWEIAWMRVDDDTPTVHKAADLERFRGRLAPAWDAPFHARFDPDTATLRDDVADELAKALADRPAVAGSNPGFDQRHIAVNWPELDDTWFHHPVDVPTLICGSSAAGDPPPPWRLSQAAEWAGIDRDAYPRHTAAGDVLLTRDLYIKWRHG